MRKIIQNVAKVKIKKIHYIGDMQHKKNQTKQKKRC